MPALSKTILHDLKKMIDEINGGVDTLSKDSQMNKLEIVMEYLYKNKIREYGDTPDNTSRSTSDKFLRVFRHKLLEFGQSEPDWGKPMEYYNKIFGPLTYNRILKFKNSRRDRLRLSDFHFHTKSKQLNGITRLLREKLLDGDDARGIPYLPVELVDMIIDKIPKKDVSFHFIMRARLYRTDVISPYYEWDDPARFEIYPINNNTACGFKTTLGNDCKMKRYNFLGYGGGLSCGCYRHARVNGPRIVREILRDYQ
jgi:hypothetical protein